MSGRDLLVGAVFAGVLALGAWRARALSGSGAVAAFAVGALTYGSGAVPFALVLLAFFLPSVALSRLGKRRKRALVDIGKGGARDAFQVLANGGVATLCAVLFALSRDPRWAWAFAGAYAAATADTWATELGTLARRAPRSILTLRPVPTGLSGGITLPGTLAELVGALWIGAVALVCFTIPLGGLGAQFQAGAELVPSPAPGFRCSPWHSRAWWDRPRTRCSARRFRNCAAATPAGETARPTRTTAARRPGSSAGCPARPTTW